MPLVYGRDGRGGPGPGVTTVPARVAWLTDTLLAPATDGVPRPSCPSSVPISYATCRRSELSSPTESASRWTASRSAPHTGTPSGACRSTTPSCRRRGRCRRAVGVAAVQPLRPWAFAQPRRGGASTVLAEGLEDASVASRDGRGQGTVVGVVVRRTVRRGSSRGVRRGGHLGDATADGCAIGRRSPRPVIGGRDDWWPCPGGAPIVLKGRAEVRTLVGRRPALLVVGTGRCQADWRIELGYPGLVAALGRDAPVAPCRVVGVWPQSGQVRVLPVDVGALRPTATAVVAAVATWVDSRIEAQRAVGTSGALDAVAVSVDGAVRRKGFSTSPAYSA